MKSIRIGTRGSALALVQAGLVQRELERLGTAAELVVIQTAGDQRPPDTAWGEGAFVSALERALIEGSIDAAVHSAKDIPTDEDSRLRIAAYLPRAEPRDALVVRDAAGPTTLAALLPGTVIGTDSPRRSGFLRAFRGDLEIRPLHGNVDTRLRRLDEGDVDALVLAAAGLIRLGREDRIAQLISESIIPPAPGQGALAVQVRAGDTEVIHLIGVLDHHATRQAIEAERGFLAATGGGCRAPIGALASADEVDGGLVLLAGFATIDGRLVAFDQAHLEPGVEATPIGELAARLVRRRAQLADAAQVLVCRPEEQARLLGARLLEHGLAPLVVPTIAIELIPASIPLTEYETWIVATSANAVRAIAGAAPAKWPTTCHWAVIGKETARELMSLGLRGAWRPSSADATTLARELPVSAQDRVVILAGSLTDGAVAASLRQRGAQVEVMTVYRTIEAPAGSRPMLRRALEGGRLAAVIVASPSQVRGLLALADKSQRERLESLPFVCVGPTTAAAAQEAGFHVATASSPTAEAVAEKAAQVIARLPTEAHA